MVLDRKFWILHSYIWSALLRYFSRKGGFALKGQAKRVAKGQAKRVAKGQAKAGQCQEIGLTQLGTGPQHTPGPYGSAVQDAPNPDTDPAISFAFARRCKSPIIATIRSGLTVLCRTLLMPTVVLLILGAGYITLGVF